MADQFYFVQSDRINKLTDELDSAKRTIKTMLFIMVCMGIMLIASVM